MKIEKDIQIAQILIDIETKRERERCIDRGRDRDVDKRQQTGKQIDRCRFRCRKQLHGYRYMTKKNRSSIPPMMDDECIEKEHSIYR